MAFVPIGPCQILVGNPTTTSGAGMTNLGDTENVTIDLGIKIAYTSSARRQGAAQADSIYYMTPEPVVSAELKDAEVTSLEQLIPNGELKTDVVGFGDTFTHMYVAGASTLPSIAIIPETQKADGHDAANGIWFPAGVISGLSGLQFGRVTEGEINQPYTTEIRSAYRDTDHDSVTIAQNFRLGWMGPPTNVPITNWSLPALL